MRSLLLLLCTTVSAAALQIPLNGQEDPQVRTQAYSQFNRTLIVTTVGRVTNITFGVSERIKRVMMGQDNSPLATPDPEKLKNVPLRNNLPLTAVDVGVTDLLVITALPDDSERTYQFIVKVKPAVKGEEDPEAVYGLVFTYPREEQAVKQQVVQQSYKEKKELKAKQEAEARLATDIFYGKRNYRYFGQASTGSQDIAPYEVSDNGRLTAFRYPGNMAVPTLYTVDSPAWCDPKSEPPSWYMKAPEKTVQSSVKDDMLVVHQTAQHFRARLGQKVVEVYNCGYDPIGENPGTGTGDPSVVRRVISTK